MQAIQSDGLTFHYGCDYELWRARTLLTKEPGTIGWLNAHLKPGDVFYDIGANIGCYTLYSARLVGETGGVCAFEPHPANLLSLVRNIAMNGFVDRCAVIGAPLHSRAYPLFYRFGSLAAGSSGHQFGGDGGTVLMQGVTLDRLFRETGLRPPTLIKIDVDGNEPDILAGMADLFEEFPPRSIQVELNGDKAIAVLESFGYRLLQRHYTAAGKEQIERGADPLAIPHNGIFEKMAVPA